MGYIRSTNGKFVDYFGRQIEIGDEVVFAGTSYGHGIEYYATGIVVDLMTFKNENKDDYCKLKNVYDGRHEVSSYIMKKACSGCVILNKYYDI